MRIHPTPLSPVMFCPLLVQTQTEFGSSRRRSLICPFSLSISSTQVREGSVRNGVAPDFKAPLGNLGKIGLAHKGSKTVQQALAFGDADGFKPSKDAAAREGSVRNGVSMALRSHL